MTIESNPYVLMSEWRLRRAYKRLFREIQRLELDRCGILAEKLRPEMARIAAELTRRG